MERREQDPGAARRVAQPAAPSTAQDAEFAVACHECALVQRVPPINTHQRLECARCGAVLHKPAAGQGHWLLPLVVAAAICFVLANTVSILAIEVNGVGVSTTLAGTTLALVGNHMPLIALVMLLTTLLLPSFDLAVLAAAALALEGLHRPQGLDRALRWMHEMRRWAMVEIFMLGALVSIVKLASFARVTPGMGMWALLAYVALSLVAHESFEGADYWSRTRAMT